MTILSTGLSRFFLFSFLFRRHCSLCFRERTGVVDADFWNHYWHRGEEIWIKIPLSVERDGIADATPARGDYATPEGRENDALVASE